MSYIICDVCCYSCWDPVPKDHISLVNTYINKAGNKFECSYCRLMVYTKRLKKIVNNLPNYDELYDTITHMYNVGKKFSLPSSLIIGVLTKIIHSRSKMGY